VLGATDSRVRCVVSQIPHVSGRRTSLAMYSASQRKRIEQRLEVDRAARRTGAQPEMVPVFSSDAEQLCALLPAMSDRNIAAARRATPGWSNEVTLRSLQAMLEFEPAAWIGYISPKPFMMIVGTLDDCTLAEIQLDAYSKANEPKRLVVHPGGHFDTYTDHFVATSRSAVEWFGEHLKLREYA